MNILDIIVLGLIVFMMVQGMSKGLVLSLFNFVYFFISVFCAVKFYPIVSSMIMNTPLFKLINEKVLNNIYQSTLSHMETSNTNQELLSANTIFDSISLPEKIKDVLIKKNDYSLMDSLPLDGIMEGISENIATFIVNGISMILIYFIVRIALYFIANILNQFAKLPLIHTVNRLAGGFFGVISGICVVYIICAVLALFSNIKVFHDLIELINNSTIASIFYNHNILLMWVL